LSLHIPWTLPLLLNVLSAAMVVSLVCSFLSSRSVCVFSLLSSTSSSAPMWRCECGFNLHWVCICERVNEEYQWWFVFLWDIHWNLQVFSYNVANVSVSNVQFGILDCSNVSICILHTSNIYRKVSNLTSVSFEKITNNKINNKMIFTWNSPIRVSLLSQRSLLPHQKSCCSNKYLLNYKTKSQKISIHHMKK
jgi:hypothetical protein